MRFGKGIDGIAATLQVTCNQGAVMPVARKSSSEKVRMHRERLRALGLRPVQVWVPDTRLPAFQAEARRQSLAVASSDHATDDQAFIDSVSSWLND